MSKPIYLNEDGYEVDPNCERIEELQIALENVLELFDEDTIEIFDDENGSTFVAQIPDDSFEILEQAREVLCRE